jgi:hypothetical protein
MDKTGSISRACGKTKRCRIAFLRRGEPIVSSKLSPNPVVWSPLQDKIIFFSENSQGIMVFFSIKKLSKLGSTVDDSI